MKKRAWLAVFLVPFLAAAPAAFADGDGPVLSLRAGIPTDTLMNIADLYHFGLALEAGLGWQVNPWLILGGQADFGVSFGKSPVVSDYRYQAAAAARIGYGRLDGFSGSLVLGLVAFLGDQVIPCVGFSLDYRSFSLGLSTGTVSAGINLRL